jgi:hypothetical protein
LRESESFIKMVTDAAFIDDAKKRNLELVHATGEALERSAKEVVTQPPEVIDRVKKLMGK